MRRCMPILSLATLATFCYIVALPGVHHVPQHVIVRPRTDVITQLPIRFIPPTPAHTPAPALEQLPIVKLDRYDASLLCRSVNAFGLSLFTDSTLRRKLVPRYSKIVPVSADDWDISLQLWADEHQCAPADVGWRECTVTTAKCGGTTTSNRGIGGANHWLRTGMNIPPCCKRHLREMIAALGDVMRRHHLPHWACYGTLLGLARNGDISPVDYDADMCFLVQHALNSSTSPRQQHVPLSDAHVRPHFGEVDRVFEQMAQTASRVYGMQLAKHYDESVGLPFFRLFYSDTNRLHIDIYGLLTDVVEEHDRDEYVTLMNELLDSQMHHNSYERRAPYTSAFFGSAQGDVSVHYLPDGAGFFLDGDIFPTRARTFAAFNASRISLPRNPHKVLRSVYGSGFTELEYSEWCEAECREVRQCVDRTHVQWWRNDTLLSEVLSYRFTSTSANAAASACT